LLTLSFSVLPLEEDVCFRPLALAGAFFSLLIFFVGLIPGYPGIFVVTHGTPTPASLVLSLLQPCLWSIGGGLLSLFGPWVATLKASYYYRYYRKKWRGDPLSNAARGDE